jgi:DNA-binding FrmR family transcriptional regulator
MAARSALNQAALQVIGHSMRSCLKEGAKERDDIVEEAIALFMKYSGGSA